MTSPLISNEMKIPRILEYVRPSVRLSIIIIRWLSPMAFNNSSMMMYNVPERISQELSWKAFNL